MLVHKPVSLPVAKLRPFGDALKKPIGPNQLAGVRKSIQEFGFDGVLSVALDADGMYTVINGNTRLEELLAAGVADIPCNVHDDMAWDQPEFMTRRRQFVMAYDKHFKVFDSTRVLEELKDMVAKGTDVAKLSSLCGVNKLKRIIDEDNAVSSAATASASAAQAKIAAQPIKPMESMILYGPADEITRIKGLIKSLKGRFTASQKVSALLEQANANLDVEDDALLTILLATLAAHRETTLATALDDSEESDE